MQLTNSVTIDHGRIVTGGFESVAYEVTIHDESKTDDGFFLLDDWFEALTEAREAAIALGINVTITPHAIAVAGMESGFCPTCAEDSMVNAGMVTEH